MFSWQALGFLKAVKVLHLILSPVCAGKQVMTCGFSVVPFRFSRPRPAGSEWDLCNASGLSLLSCEITPAAICFVFPPRLRVSLLFGPVKLCFTPIEPGAYLTAGLGKLASTESFCALYLRLVSLLCLYYTTPPRPCLFAKQPTFSGNICTCLGLINANQYGTIDMLGQNCRPPSCGKAAGFLRQMTSCHEEIMQGGLLSPPKACRCGHLSRRRRAPPHRQPASKPS